MSDKHTTDKRCRVFISYRHGPPNFMNWVQNLSQRLRQADFECEYDQYEVAPPNGFDRWSEKQIHDSNYILCICTADYRECFEDRAPRGECRGVKFEGSLIRAAIYNNDSHNDRFIPVVMSREDLRHIPCVLSTAKYFVLNTEKGISDLIDRMLNIPPVVPPPIGPPLKLAQLQYQCVNAQGYEEYTFHRDRSVMVRIPAGEFWMGNVRGEGSGNECPQHSVYLDEYLIDKYPVTNAQFELFAKATGYKTDAESEGGWGLVPDFLGRWDKDEGATWHVFSNLLTRNHPVVLVTPHDAEAYCDWARKRLPTEAEWEKASRGSDGREWPWGDDLPNETRGNFGKYLTMPVDSHPSGVTPYGCMDMVGNAWEWCRDFYEEDYYYRSPHKNPPGPSAGSKRVNRGGSWWDGKDSLRCARRGGDDPFAYMHVGFRCVMDAASRNDDGRVGTSGGASR